MTKIRDYPFTLILLLLALLLPCTVPAFDAEREDISSFVDNLAAEHGIEAAYIRATLAQSESKQSILDAISRPAERTLDWHEYRDIFITRKRVNAGIEFIEEYREKLERASEKTGVPVEFIAAIVGVETFYGRITGNYRAIDALATLGFDYPPRAKFFRKELGELFLLAREEQLELTEIKGSYAGAMGPPQFIPSSYRAYAVDGDGDGRRDLLGNWDDILTSVGNYFARHKWKPGQQVTLRAEADRVLNAKPADNSLKMTTTLDDLRQRGLIFDSTLDGDTPAELISFIGAEGPEYWIGLHNFYVITRYNRSTMYAMAVFQLAEALSTGPVAQTDPAEFDTPRLGQIQH